jgi:hypothetical protein
VSQPTSTGPNGDFFGRLAFSPDTGALASLYDEYAQTQGGLPQTSGTALRLAVPTARAEVIDLRAFVEAADCHTDGDRASERTQLPAVRNLSSWTRPSSTAPTS